MIDENKSVGNKFVGKFAFNSLDGQGLANNFVFGDEKSEKELESLFH